MYHTNPVMPNEMEEVSQKLLGYWALAKFRLLMRRGECLLREVLVINVTAIITPKAERLWNVQCVVEQE